MPSLPVDLRSLRRSRWSGRASAIALSCSFLSLGCGSAPKPERDPALEQRFRQEQSDRQTAIDRAEEADRILLRLDEALASWVANQSHSENEKANIKADRLSRYLEAQATKHAADLLQRLQSDDARQRGIAAGALGFTHRTSMVAPLLDAVGDKETLVRSNACLGLGVLGVPHTPLDSLNAIYLSDDEDVTLRRSAAWALLRLQVSGAPRAGFSEVWTRMLGSDPLGKDPLLVVAALRGVGLLRDPGLAPRLVPYLSHPTPLVRQATLIAIGRSGDREVAARVLPFLGNQELNPNVRLTARKALKALAGNRIDHRYDLRAWRKEFGILDDDRQR